MRGSLSSGSHVAPPRQLARSHLSAAPICSRQTASPCAHVPTASPWAHLYVAAARALHRKRSASARVSSWRASARRKKRTPSPSKHEARSSRGSGAAAVSRDALDVARGSPARDALVCTRSLASSAREPRTRIAPPATCAMAIGSGCGLRYQSCELSQTCL